MMIEDGIIVQIGEQQAQLWQCGKLVRSYLVSTASKGAGQQMDSWQTPLGRHEICEKIGHDAAVNTVFRHRKPTGELYTSYLHRVQPGRDWILTRILRLAGLEEGFNRGGTVDTRQRCIYFHGAPDELPMGIAASHGCIRMHNWDIIDLFGRVQVGTFVLITA